MIRDSFRHWGVDESWRDAIDPNPKLAQLFGGGQGEPDHAGLGGSVVGLPRVASLGWIETKE